MKERVIGASVLVGLAVWLIPWVLDGPVPDADSGTARTPAAERSAPLRTQTIRLENQQDTSAQSSAPDVPGTPVPQDSGDVAAVTPEVLAGALRETGNAPGRAASAAGSSSTPPVDAVSGWLVQVGSFRDEENARRQADRLANVGYTARLYPHRSGGELWHRVRVGPEASREGADEIVSSLRDQGFRAEVVSSD